MKDRSWSLCSAQSIERFENGFLKLLDTSETMDLVKNQVQKKDQAQIPHLYGLMVGIKLFLPTTGICAMHARLLVRGPLPSNLVTIGVFLGLQSQKLC